jgi:hypothetical protein
VLCGGAQQKKVSSHEFPGKAFMELLGYLLFSCLLLFRTPLSRCFNGFGKAFNQCDIIIPPTAFFSYI